MGISSPSSPSPSVSALSAPAPFQCPPGHFDCFNNQISDNQIRTALWVSVAAGSIMLLIFGICRRWVPTYKMRLTLPNVWIKPPPLPEGGTHLLWSWLQPVFATSDADLVRTAGLDSLILCWTASLGIQVFLPLTVIGMAILLPVNLYGERDEQLHNLTSGAVAFQRLTLSSLERGSQKYWIAFVFVYAATAYICWLLVKYYQAYAILRQRYMTGGEALINQWHDRILTSNANSTLHAKASKSRAAAEEDHSMWTAVRGLLHVQPQLEPLPDSLGGSQMHSWERWDDHEGAKLTSLEDVSLQSLPAADVPSSSHAQLRAHLRNSLQQQRGAGTALQLAVLPSIADDEEQEQSLRSCYMQGSDKATAPSSQAMGRGDKKAANGHGVDVQHDQESEKEDFNIKARLRSSSDPGSSAPDIETGDVSVPEPISRYETRPPKVKGHGSIHKWWTSTRVDSTDASEDSEARQHEQQQQHLSGKPSVFFRKTVNAELEDGRVVAVNAQQYAVLVMDAPDLRMQRTRSVRHDARKLGWKRWWQGAKAWLYPAVKKRRKHSAASDKSSTDNLSVAAKEDSQTSSQAGSHSFTQGAADLEGGRTWMSPATAAVSPNVDLKLENVFETMRSAGEESWHEEVATLTPLQLVEATFRRLFPDTFQYALPVWRHKSVDALLWQWDDAYGKLLRCEARYEAGGCKKRPTHRAERCGGPGSRVDSIDFWAQRVRELETATEREQNRVLGGATSPSFFAFFLTQKDAAFAAQTRLHSEDGHSFRVMEAPGPEEVNWQVLWKTSRERTTREIMVFPLILLIMLIPLGLFSGTLAQATAAICGGVDRLQEGRLSFLATSWYCREDSLARPLITSIVPSLLLTIWQSLIMPIVLYILAQMEGQSPSLSRLDRRISSLFFTWGVFNVFLGAMLGGSIFSKIRLVLAAPSSTPDILGAALTSSSNFFINFVIIQAFAVNPSRLLFPHCGIIFDLLQCCGCCRPRNQRDRMAGLNSGMSVGYGREIGVIMLIYIMAMAYAASSPIILPFALCYFITAWVMWRYTILYTTERCYESGGLLWDQVFTQICWCLFIFEFFTGCVFLANSAYVQASVLWVTLTPLLFKFHSYATTRYGEAVAHMPLETSHAAPEAKVDPIVYTPPALRPGCAGWYPEHGKAWENWGVPAYVP